MPDPIDETPNPAPPAPTNAPSDAPIPTPDTPVADPTTTAVLDNDVAAVVEEPPVGSGPVAPAPDFDSTSERVGNAYGLSSEAATNFQRDALARAAEYRRLADEADADAAQYAPFITTEG